MICSRTTYGIFGFVCIVILVLMNMFIYTYTFRNFSAISRYSVLTNRSVFDRNVTIRVHYVITTESNGRKSTKLSPLYLKSRFSNRSIMDSTIEKNIKLNDTNNSTGSVNKDIKLTTIKLHLNMATPTFKPEVDGYFRQTHFMSISGGGRLGNRMFEFASLLGIADRHGYTPFISPGHALNMVFDIPQTRGIKMTNVKGFGEISAGLYDKHTEELGHGTNWSLSGYYQSWKYFEHVKDKVRNSFKFKQSVLTDAKNNLLQWNSQKRPTVGVHIRRKDMASAYELARGYCAAPLSFIEKAMNYFRKKFEKPIFILVGDDRTWMKQFVKGDDVIHTPHGSPGNDMAILANCEHGIVTTGTFGWWGAWLTGGHVVYFKNFPTPGSWLDKRYNKTDYYPPNWIGMV